MRFKVIAQDFGSPYVHFTAYHIAATSRVKELVGKNDVATAGEFAKDTWKMAVVEKDWEKQGRRALKRLESAAYLKKVYDGQKRSVRQMLSYAQKLRRANFSINTPAQLASSYENLFGLWIEANKWGHVPNLTDFEHNMLTDKCLALLDARVRSLHAKISAPEAFSILTTPNEKSPFQRQDYDFYGLLEKIEESHDAQKLFKKELPEIISMLNEHPKTSKLLAAHVEKYDWLQFHYDGLGIAGEEYFADVLRSEVLQGVSGKKKLAELKARDRDVARQQAKVATQLRLGKEEIYWMEVAKTMLYLKGLRKDAIFQASRMTDPLIREIAKRLHLSPKQVRHMHLEEIRRAFKTGSADAALLNQRVSHCILIVKKGVPKLYVGKKAKRLAKQFYADEADESVQEIKGTPAFPGKARGIVRIIHRAQDMAKMKDGDILVSPATNPNVVPAMKKAAAIVTDEGGITCHAAIVSRELKIPCVIGTKVATKWLKDGDRVEVDATKGTIRKV